MLQVFKGADNQYRWVSISSSAFEDRTEETVTTGAVDFSLKASGGDYGELRLYHLPGSQVGTCDLSMRVGMFLFESGIFDNTKNARTVRKAINASPDKYGVSIGFRYDKRDLVDSKYHKIQIFERSIVEEVDAAALFTNIKMDNELVMEDKLMKDKEKLIEKLAELVGDSETANELVRKADEIGIKMSTGEAIAFKEDEKPANTDTNEEEAIQETEEAVVEEETVKEPAEEPVVEEKEEAIEKSLTDLVLELDKETIAAIAQKVAQEVAMPKIDISNIERTIKALSESLDSLGEMVTHLLKTDEEKMQEMQKQLPRFRAGLSYRPSTTIATKTDAPAEPTVEADEATNSQPRNLASDIEAIQEYRRRNLKVVHG